jgi:hypothetical protein
VPEVHAARNDADGYLVRQDEQQAHRPQRSGPLSGGDVGH